MQKIIERLQFWAEVSRGVSAILGALAWIVFWIWAIGHFYKHVW